MGSLGQVALRDSKFRRDISLHWNHSSKPLQTFGGKFSPASILKTLERKVSDWGQPWPSFLTTTLPRESYYWDAGYQPPSSYTFVHMYYSGPTTYFLTINITDFIDVGLCDHASPDDPRLRPNTKSKNGSSSRIIPCQQATWTSESLLNMAGPIWMR